jgi:hypothetical protein
MSSASFQIIYDGQGLGGNEIDIKVLSPALMAISDLLEEADRVVNKGETKSIVKVKASFQTGCFKIDFTSYQSFIKSVQNILEVSGAETIITATSLTALIFGTTIYTGKSLFFLIKWLKGRKPIKIIDLKNGNFQVFRSDSCIEVEQKVIDLYRDYKVRKSFEQTVIPLESEGIDSFAINIDNHIIDTITKEEASYFVVENVDSEELDKKEFETFINLHRISFNEKNKWYVSDGTSSYSVLVEDTDYIHKIDKGDISFAKTDLLKVVIQLTQYQTDEGLKAKYVIKKVLSHNKKPQQIKLDIEDDKP